MTQSDMTKAIIPGVTIRTSNYDDISVQITDPDFPMLRIWIDMRLFDDFRLEFPNPRYDIVELIGLEPK